MFFRHYLLWPVMRIMHTTGQRKQQDLLLLLVLTYDWNTRRLYACAREQIATQFWPTVRLNNAIRGRRVGIGPVMNGVAANQIHTPTPFILYITPQNIRRVLGAKIAKHLLIPMM